MASKAPPRKDVGRTLRRARQRHHVELQDASETTRIPKRFLEALEDNAPLETFPAPIYARAFLREYARFLDLDPEPLVETLAGGGPVQEVRLSSIKDAVPPPRVWPQRVLLGLSICVLVGLAVVGVLSGRSKVPPARSIPPSPVAAGRAPSPHASPPPAQARALRAIDLRVRISDRCWLMAVADGRIVFKGTLMPGQSRLLRARQMLALTLGNAGGADLLVAGKAIPTGPAGQVIHLTMSLHHGRVHVTRV